MSDLPPPVINALNAPFWEAAKSGRFSLPYCVTSNRTFWPPSPVSPFVDGGAVAWREIAAEGMVRALAVYQRVFLKAFEAITPFAIALVEVADGARLQAHVSGGAALAPGDVAALRFAPLVEGGPPVLIADAKRL